jgi:micrococcal nuclease
MKKWTFRSIVPIVIAGLCILASADQDFKGMVSAVLDGDTIEVLGPSRPEKIRLADIDCPELHQEYGFKAKQITNSLVFGREVTVRPTGKDRYGRIIAEVFINGRSLNEELIRTGAAWWFEKYSKNLKLKTIELQTKDAKLGLWASPTAIAPWDYRAQKKVETNGNSKTIDAESGTSSAGQAPSSKPQSGSSSPVYTGPRGGRYTINSQGNKSYQPRR